MKSLMKRSLITICLLMAAIVAKAQIIHEAENFELDAAIPSAESHEYHASSYIELVPGFEAAPQSGQYVMLDAKGHGGVDDNVLTLSIYPNPTQGIFTVSGKGIRQVRLYNLLGQQVAAAPSYNGNNVMLNTSSLAAGIYMVQVFAENGMYVKHVVVGRAY